MWNIQQYHPAEAEALACFELKLSITLENYFRGLRERIASLTERDGLLPVTFWRCERDSLMALLAPVYEAGLRLGLELERSPRIAFNPFVNVNNQLQATIQNLAGDLAQEITVSVADRVNDMLHIGLNAYGLPDRLRDELRLDILSESRAEQIAHDESARILSAATLLARPPRQYERMNTLVYEDNRLCV